MVFKQLGRAEVRTIADLELAKTAARMRERGIALEVRDGGQARAAGGGRRVEAGTGAVFSGGSCGPPLLEGRCCCFLKFSVICSCSFRAGVSTLRGTPSWQLAAAPLQPPVP